MHTYRILRAAAAGSVETVYNVFDKVHLSRLKSFYRNEEFDVVIDVGSHKGEFLNGVIDDETPIYCFEPQPDIREILIKNTAAKNVIEYFEHPICDQEKTAQFHFNRLSSTSSLVRPTSNSIWGSFKSLVLGGGLEHGSMTVTTKTLDSCLIAKLNPLHRVMIKIDVEGGEGPVLQGARRLLESRNVVLVQIEMARYKARESIKGACPVGILESYGFRLAKNLTFPLGNFVDLIYRRSPVKA